MSSKRTEAPGSILNQQHETNKRRRRHRGPDDDLFFKSLGVIFENAKYLKLVDLQALLNTSKVSQAFLVQSYPWESHFLREPDRTTAISRVQEERSLPSLNVPSPFGFISREKWGKPDYPTNVVDTFELHIPPRARARDSRRPDDRCYFPHRTDTAARGLVLVENAFYDGYGLSQFNAETGVLEDFFLPEDEDPAYERTEVWLPRELPIECDKCGVNCHSYPELIAHCTTYEHQKNSVRPNRQLSEEFWDPRNRSDFLELSPFERVRALLQFRNAVMQALRAPMDAAGVRVMKEIEAWALDRGPAINFDITLENITNLCTRLVAGEFCDWLLMGKGIKAECHVRDVLSQGWGAFQWYRVDMLENLKGIWYT